MKRTLSPRFIKPGILISLLFTLTFLSGQTSLTGTIIDDKGQPVSYSNVLLLAAADSSLVRGSVTDDNGHFEIKNATSGTYLLRGFMIGYADYYSELFTLEDNSTVKDFGTITLYEDAVLMNTVEVVAKKPLFEQKIDRMVVNVSNSITSAGTNALEVLERTPGIIVNHQTNTLSLSGKNGVVVMINGRINYMPPEAVTRLLEGMPADNIERIEVITTPPAGFDAEGNAGYINIVLKRNIDEGFNGSLGFGVGFGHGEQGSANLNFNYRKGITNIYGDYGYTKEAQEQVFSFYRRILLEGDQVETDTRSVRDPDADNHNARLGVDFQLDPKTVLGFLTTWYDTKWTMDAVNKSLISKNGLLDSSIIISNYELNQWKHAGGNVNLQHTFKEGKVLSFDTDLLWYKDNNPTTYENEYYDSEENFVYEEFTRSKKITPINILVGKIDYTTPIGKKMKLETGIKTTFSHFTNDVGVDYLVGSSWEPVPELTAKYDLDEEILAGYASLETPVVAGFNLKAGLRYEYTSSNLGSLEEPDIVDRQFGEWFPSVFLSKDINEHNSINFSYSKRISRPTFNDMAPFAIFVDPYTFFTGNPALQPGLSNNFKAGYRYKSLLFSLEYSIEDSTIARFQSSIVPGTNTQLLYAENLVGTNTTAATLSIPFTPVKWWNMYFNINFNYQVAKKYIENKLTSFEAGGLGVFSSQTFTLPKDFTFEVNGFYGTGGLFGVYEVAPIGSINVGLQKKLGEKWGTLRIGYDDVLNTLEFSGESNLPEQNQYFSATLKFAQPTFKISYSYNFGNQKIKNIGDQKSGAEEERQRIKQ